MFRDRARLSDRCVAAHEPGGVGGLGCLVTLGPVAGGDGVDVGLNNITELTHPEVMGSVMNYGNVPRSYVSVVAYDFDEDVCSPHPFDLVAINALYQIVR